MKISEQVLRTLDQAEIDGPRVRLVGQLDRKHYVDVNKVLEAAGGKWDRKAKAHVFEADPGEVLEQAILTGEIISRKQELGFFETPEEIGRRMIAAAGIHPAHDCMEPQAGRGALVKLMLECKPRSIRAYEVDAAHLPYLNELVVPSVGSLGGGIERPALQVHLGDFLKVDPVPARAMMVDRIVMNPPFAKRADIHHVMHAKRFLRPGGRLVAIMSAGTTFRTDRLTRDFMAGFEDESLTIEALPDGAFSESGTMVRTIMLTYDRPGIA